MFLHYYVTIKNTYFVFVSFAFFWIKALIVFINFQMLAIKPEYKTCQPPSLIITNKWQNQVILHVYSFIDTFLKWQLGLQCAI